MTFRFDKLTIKAQEAVSQAQNLAERGGTSRRWIRCTCWQRCWRESRRRRQADSGQDRRNAGGSWKAWLNAEVARLPKVSGGSGAPGQHAAPRRAGGAVRRKPRG